MPKPRTTNDRAKQSLEAIRSIAEMFTANETPAELDQRYGRALRTIFNVADNALHGSVADAR